MCDAMHHIRLQSRSTFTLTHQISCPLSPSMITIKHRRSSKTRNTLTEKWLLEYLPNSSKYLLSIFLILPSKSVLNVLENWLWFPLCMKLQKKLKINENCCLKWLNSLKIFKILPQDMLLHIFGRIFRTPWIKVANLKWVKSRLRKSAFEEPLWSNI